VLTELVWEPTKKNVQKSHIVWKIKKLVDQYTLLRKINQTTKYVTKVQKFEMLLFLLKIDPATWEVSPKYQVMKAMVEALKVSCQQQKEPSL
jgi:hypothetical protein